MPEEPHDAPEGREAPASPDRDLPASLVPRWLAWLVLVALLAAATFSVVSLLGAPAPSPSPMANEQPR